MAMQTANPVKPTIICGPPGVGKRTLIKKLTTKYPNIFTMIISHTTRSPKNHEKNGVHYHFISKDEFKKDIADNKFLEHQFINNNYYGTSYKSLKVISNSQNNNNNIIYLLDLNILAAQTIKNDKINNYKIQFNYLFLSTSFGLDTLKKRLMQRNNDKIIINNKLKIGENNLKFLENNPLFFDSVIYNDKDINETIFLLNEQFKSWYPHLKDQLNINSYDVDVNDDYDPNALNDTRKVFRASKRQSGDFYNDLNAFITRERKIKNIFCSSISPIQYNDDIVNLITEYTDIGPKDYILSHKWLDICNEFNNVINRISYVEHRWTLGHSCNYYPKLNNINIGCIYFAKKEEIMTGFMYYIVGTVRCPIFTKKFYVNEYNDNDWDECWDVYFYMKVASDLRGSIQFSRAWSNMLIFGLDSDALRQSTENGNWKLNDKPNKNFILQNLSIEENMIEDDDQIDDQ